MTEDGLTPEAALYSEREAHAITIRERDAALAQRDHHVRRILQVCSERDNEKLRADEWRKTAQQLARERDKAREALGTSERFRVEDGTDHGIELVQALRERNEALAKYQNCFEDREGIAGKLTEALRDRIVARALLIEGLNLWSNEPKQSLRSDWLDFWAKVRRLTEEQEAK